MCNKITSKQVRTHWDQWSTITSKPLCLITARCSESIVWYLSKSMDTFPVNRGFSHWIWLNPEVSAILKLLSMVISPHEPAIAVSAIILCGERPYFSAKSDPHPLYFWLLCAWLTTLRLRQRLNVFVCDGSWDSPWSITGWEGPMNCDWVWPLAVGFFCVLQFFLRFLPLLDLVFSGQWPDLRWTSRPAARLSTSCPSCAASVILDDDIWFFFHEVSCSIALSFAFKRTLSLTSTWATSKRDKFRLSLFAQPAWTTSAKFICLANGLRHKFSTSF